MTQEQKNNPLHGVKLEALVNEIVDEYGWETLAHEMNLNCFKTNPSVKSTLKFLRRTEWAREKVERFYLYDYKQLPRPGDDQYDIPPRKRVISKSQETSSRNETIEKEPVIPKKQNSTSKEVDKTTNEKDTKKPSSSFNPWENSRHK